MTQHVQPEGVFAHLIPADVRETVRARRMTDTFEVFALSESGFLRPIGEADSLRAAQDIGSVNSQHKGRFVIRTTFATGGRPVLSIYVMKQGKEGWRRADPYMAHAVRVRPLKAVHECDIQAGIL